MTSGGTAVGMGEAQTPPMTEAQWAATAGANLNAKALNAIAAALGVSASATIT